MGDSFFSARTRIRRANYMLRYTLVRKVVNSVNGLEHALAPDDLKREEFVGCKSRISLLLRTSIDRSTGRILAPAAPSVTNAIYGQILQSLGEKKATELGLSREKILASLEENQLIAAEELEPGLARKSKSFMRGLIESVNIKQIWELIPKSIIDMGIAFAVAAYEVMPTDVASYEKPEDIQLPLIHERGRTGIKGESRYKDDWGVPKGEKALTLYLPLLVAHYIGRSKGVLRGDRITLVKRLRFFEMDRHLWPLFGLNRGIMKKALEDSGLGSISAGFTASKRAKSYVKEMGAIMERHLCLSEDLIDTCGAKFLQGFIAEQGEISEKEKEELIQAHNAAVDQMKQAVRKAVAAIFHNKERKAASKETMGKSGMGLLDEMVNTADSFGVFRRIVRYYCEAIEDIESDKKRLGLSDAQAEEYLSNNFYYTVLDQNFCPIALVLANNHDKSIDAKKNIPLFQGIMEIKKQILTALFEISDTIATTIQFRVQQQESQRGREQAELQHELTRTLIDEVKDVKARLESIIGMIPKLFKRNGEKIDSSILILDPEQQNEMEIFASTRIDEKTKTNIAGTRTAIFNEKGKLTGIAAWVASIKKSLFVANGNTYINGAMISSDDLEAMRSSEPMVYEEIKRVTSNINSTFMCVPLISLGAEGKLHGVVSVSGARLAEKDMSILKTIADTIFMSLRNHFQAQELKLEKERFEVMTKELEKANKKLADTLADRINLYELLEKQARIDELTQLLRRVVLEDTFKPAVEKTLKIPGDDLSIFMIDIDHFKLVNDTYGHKTGDIMLQKVSDAVRKFFAEEACRYGGEEDFAWKRHLTSEEANKLGEELRLFIEKMPVETLDGKTIYATVSIGIASLSKDYDPQAANPVDSFIDCADIALYGAKELIGVGRETSRNQCWVYSKEVAKMVEDMRKEKKTILNQAKEKYEAIKTALAAGNIEELKGLVDEFGKILMLLKVN